MHSKRLGFLRRYNTTLKTEFGASAFTAIADTGNGGLSAFGPFEFIMQPVGQMMPLCFPCQDFACIAYCYSKINKDGMLTRPYILG